MLRFIPNLSNLCNKKIMVKDTIIEKSKKRRALCLNLFMTISRKLPPGNFFCYIVCVLIEILQTLYNIQHHLMVLCTMWTSRKIQFTK